MCFGRNCFLFISFNQKIVVEVLVAKQLDGDTPKIQNQCHSRQPLKTSDVDGDSGKLISPNQPVSNFPNQPYFSHTYPTIRSFPKACASLILGRDSRGFLSAKSPNVRFCLSL